MFRLLVYEPKLFLIELNTVSLDATAVVYWYSLNDRHALALGQWLQNAGTWLLPNVFGFYRIPRHLSSGELHHLAAKIVAGNNR